MGPIGGLLGGLLGRLTASDRTDDFEGVAVNDLDAVEIVFRHHVPVVSDGDPTPDKPLLLEIRHQGNRFWQLECPTVDCDLNRQLIDPRFWCLPSAVPTTNGSCSLGFGYEDAVGVYRVAVSIHDDGLRSVCDSVFRDDAL